MEFIFELFLEFVLQVVGEALFELGFHSMAEPFRKPPNPWLAAIGYAIFGAILGGVSILLFPHHMVEGEVWRRLNLIVTPIAVGLCMAGLGSWRARRGWEKDLARLVAVRRRHQTQPCTKARRVARQITEYRYLSCGERPEPRWQDSVRERQTASARASRLSWLRSR